MKALIPVAGLGTRLRPHTHTLAKPLIPIAGRAALSYIIDHISGFGIRDFIFITGAFKEQIEGFIKKNYPSLNSVFINQEKPLGQAHAVLLAEETIGNDECVIWFSDTLSDADLGSAKGRNTIYVKEVDDPRRFGVVITDNKGRITDVEEKPKSPRSNLVNIGVYAVHDSREMFRSIRRMIEDNKSLNGEYYLMDAFKEMIHSGTGFYAKQVDEWEDCGTPKAVLSSNRHFLSRRNVKGVKIKGDSIIIEPCFIGENAEIKESVVGPFVSLSGGAKIERSVIRESIIGEDVTIRDAVIEMSIISNHSRVNGRSRQLSIGEHSVVDLI